MACLCRLADRQDRGAALIVAEATASQLGEACLGLPSFAFGAPDLALDAVRVGEAALRPPRRIDLGDTRGGRLCSGIGDGVSGGLSRRCLERLVADPDRDRASAAGANEDDVSAVATLTVRPLSTARLPGRDAQLRRIEARLVREHEPLQCKVDPQGRQLAPQIEKQRAGLVRQSIKCPSRHVSLHAFQR